MADLGNFNRRRQPTAAEVVGRLKDDGDFDALRRAIVRKVKDNVSTPKTAPSPPNPFTFTLVFICTITPLLLLRVQMGYLLWF